MATYTWSIPVGNQITGSTKVKDTDNFLANTVDDLVDFVNGEGTHSGQGLTYDLVDKASSQTLTGQKTFSSAIIASGGVTGNVTGNVSGTSASLASSVLINGHSFNGTSGFNIAFSELSSTPTTLAGYGINDATPSSHIGSGGTSHSEVTTSVAGFMSAADKTKLNSLSNYTLPSATQTVLGGIKIYNSGSTLYITTA